MPICSSSSTNTTGFRFRTLGTWKAQSMMSAIPVKLHRLGWCFAPTAHTSAAIQLNENCSCFYNNARLFFFKIKSAIGFIMSLSMLGSHFNWTLSGTTLQLPGSSLTCKLLQSWSGNWNPSTHRHQHTNWRWPTIRMLVRLRWIEVEPSASETNFSTFHWMMGHEHKTKIFSSFDNQTA